MKRHFAGSMGATLALTALCSSLSFLVALPAAAGEWQPVGKLAEARWDFTTTLLQDGTVLVTGGRDRNFNIMRTAERFDPKTNSFTAVGRMSVGRAKWHQAVLLQDGRVLVVGGPSRNADVFDPATNTFSRVGNMLSFHDVGGTATLLTNGQVLIVGGINLAGRLLAAAELFDPATGTFRATGSLSVARCFAGAVALADGRIVVMGGENPSPKPPQLSSVEIYDPATGAFTPQGQLLLARLAPSGILLPDGRILVIGGFAGPWPDWTTLPDEIYDPATGQSVLAHPEAATHKTRAALGVVIPLQDGRILLAGGVWRYNGPLTDDHFEHHAELFDPATGKLTPTAPMSQVRGAPGAMRLGDGRVLVVGGFGPGGEGTTLDTAEVYVP